MNSIAENIARRRKELGMTQKELAEKLNISDKTLSRWETDKQVPDALSIPEIAKALDLSINELYGMKETIQEANATANELENKIDNGRISTYKMALLVGVILCAVGGWIFSAAGIFWGYTKIAGIVLLLTGFVTILTTEFTFEGFYQKQERSTEYEQIHHQWFGMVIPIAGLFIGVVLPALRIPSAPLLSLWNSILPMAFFQVMIFGLYIRSYIKCRKQGQSIKGLGSLGVSLFAVLGAALVVAYIVRAASITISTLEFSYDEWLESEMSLRAFEVGAGIAFLCMNIIHSKKMLNAFGKVFIKITRLLLIGMLMVGIVAAAAVFLINQNLKSHVTYVAGMVPMYELTNYDDEILEWIRECNRRGGEINALGTTIYVEGTGNTGRAYLFYMPHGCEDTEIQMTYGLGITGRTLKVEAENTSSIMGDSYYLCYVEVENEAKDFELQAYVNGERTDWRIDYTTYVPNVFE